MPTKCDKCKKKSYSIYITHDYEKLCGACYDKDRPEYIFNPDDLSRREGNC